jgi:ribosomal-protein-alanine N-acetyltransferase
MPSEIAVRVMKFEDLDQVYDLERQVFPNPWPKSFFESDLGLPRTVGLVAQNDGRVIGYALATSADIEFHITNVGVDPSFQRQGVASRLMDELQAIAATRGCSHAYLEVRVDNYPAIELYLKLGFKILYTRRQYYLDGTDAHVMYKNYSHAP